MSLPVWQQQRCLWTVSSNDLKMWEEVNSKTLWLLKVIPPRHNGKDGDEYRHVPFITAANVAQPPGNSASRKAQGARSLLLPCPGLAASYVLTYSKDGACHRRGKESLVSCSMYNNIDITKKYNLLSLLELIYFTSKSNRNYNKFKIPSIKSSVFSWISPRE